MTEEPTNWELDRRFNQIQQTLEAGFSRIDSRLDGMVSSDLFSLYQQTNERRIAAAEQKVEKIEAERRTDRRAAVAIGATSAVALIGAASTTIAQIFTG